MGSTAHVGIDTLNIDHPNGSNGVLWQAQLVHTHTHTSNESSVHAVESDGMNEFKLQGLFLYPLAKY